MGILDIANGKRMLSDADILDKFKEDRRITEIGLSDQYDAGEIDHAFYSGDHMAYRAGIRGEGRDRIVIFNRVKPFINSITGFAIKLRRKPDYNARQEDQQLQELYSDDVNALSDYLREDSNADHHESRQDKEMFITGYGAIDTAVSHLKNPFGELKSGNIAYNDVGWDPNARETNLLDARWVYHRKKMDREDAVKLFKGSEPEDFEDLQEIRELANRRTSLPNDAGNGAQEDLVQVFSYQWWEFEDYFRIENPIFEEDIPEDVRVSLLELMVDLKQTTEEEAEEQVEDAIINPSIADDLFEFNPDESVMIATPKIRRALKGMFEDFDITIEDTKHKRKSYFTAILSGDTVFSSFKSPDQNGFTIKFKTGDYDEINQIWRGIVEQLREPSKYANKALTEILFVIAANSKGGVMAEEDAVDDVKRFEAQYASTNAVVWVNSGALGEGKIQPKAQAALPNGYENVLEISKAAHFETTGINPEFLGASENKQVSALLEAQRIEQVTSTLAPYFDSITLYQKEAARLNLTYMRMLGENNPEMMFRVIGEEGTILFQRINQDALAAEYDVDIQEVPTSPAQKRENLGLLMNFAQQALLGGINIYPELISELPIPERKKQRIAELMKPREPSPEEQQAQQLQQQIALADAKANIDNTEADTDLKLSQIPGNVQGARETEANTGLKKAQTAKTLEEAEQKDLENNIFRTKEVDVFNLNI